MQNSFKIAGNTDSKHADAVRALEMLLSGATLRKVREALGCMYDDETGQWIDTNVVHDALLALQVLQNAK